MKVLFYWPCVCISLLIIGCAPETVPSTTESTLMIKSDIAAPVAEKQPKKLTIHDDTRIDDYYWMNQREDPKVIAYLEAENTYRRERMAHLKGLEDKLYEEIVGRIAPTDLSVPFKDNGYTYMSRFEDGKEYPIHSRTKVGENASEEILLDVNVLAEPYNYYAVGSRSVSPDNRMLAYGEDTLSRRIYTLRFKNLETGELLPDAIPNTTGSAVWAADNKTVFYTVKDDALRAYKIFRHVLGTPADEDVEIYHESDETFGCVVYKSKSKQYLIIASYQTLSNEYRVLDADNPLGEFRVIQPRERGLEYSISHYGDHFYLRTNLDAKNFRLMKTPVDQTTKEHWTEVIPHRSDVLLEGTDIFKDYLVVSERKNGLTQLRIMPWEGEEYYIEFNDPAYLVYTTTNREFDTDLLRFGYTSLTTPNSIYDYNMATKERELLKRQEVVGDFKSEDYRSERLFVEARDGVKVPVSIVYHKDKYQKDGKSPLLLYAYGSYGASMDPYFSSVRLSLLDRGFAYAIAHIRGGEEMGRHWYEDGKLLKKKNTFTDYIDVAEHLVAAKYTQTDQLFAMGGSAGGLLMGAVINMRPELFRGVVAAVPFVDVVTTMLDESIPLTTGEWDEWGNPKDPEYYAYMKSYSPYDNVTAKPYPAMLVTTGLHDSQVQYWEPAKWVAKLRELRTNDAPLFLHTDMEAGHGGASGRFARYKDTAMEYAFFLDLAGRTE